MVRRLTLLFAVLAAPAWAAPAQPDQRVAALILKQRQMLVAAGIVDQCKRTVRGDEIVVCAEREVEPTPPPPPPPRLIDIPGVSFGRPSPGMGTGASITVRGCFLQKCPREIPLIDLHAIPVAATGSDADLIARGEMPDW